LKAPVRHPIRGSRRSLRGVETWIEVRGARVHNLNNIDVRFPVGRLSVITGISGSGKSTLMHDVIFPTVRVSLGSARIPRARACVGIQRAAFHLTPKAAVARRAKVRA